MRLRPPRREDVHPIFEVIVARDLADLGIADYTLADVLVDWENPDIDVDRDWVVAESADGRIVASALVDARSAMIHVHPEHEDEGTESALREFVERRSRERGQRPSLTFPSSNRRVLEDLQAAGYGREHVYLRLTAALADVPEPSAAGLRLFDVDREGPEVHALIEEAFSEIEGNVPDSYAAWRVALDAKSPPELRLVLVDASGLLGAAVGEMWDAQTGYVAELAVARHARGAGHGRTLLLALCRALRDMGATTVHLSVHGRNAPATSLYESAGFRRAWTSERWALPA